MNIDDNELKEIKAYVRGLIEGIKDTHKPEEVDIILEDYWNAWDETLDINIWIDETDPEKYLCTLYRVRDSVRDNSTYQRLDYLRG